MSDDDFMMDDEEYDFEYEEDDDNPEEGMIDLENQYYNAKAIKDEDPREAMSQLEEVVESETEKGDWGFKALKQLIKINYKRGQLDAAHAHYQKLLTYIKSAVTKNYSEKSINNILDLISSTDNQEFMERFYDTTLNSLQDSKNERLWVRTNLKLAKMWLDRDRFNKLEPLLKKLHTACQTDDGADDQRKGTHLLEVYALEIQMHSSTKNTKRLKELYTQSLQIRSAIPHPRIMGVIRECGGKMHLSEGEWDLAMKDFFESFKCYDEAGSHQRIQVLKYLVLANMLSESTVDPFDSPETKPYRSDPHIVAMTSLVGAYQQKDIHLFESVLKDHRDEILGDPFIRDYLDDVIRSIRSQALAQFAKPYTRVTFQFLSQKLRLGISEVENLLVEMLLDNKLNGYIDQVHQRLELFNANSEDSRYTDLASFSDKLEAVYKVSMDRAY